MVDDNFHHVYLDIYLLRAWVYGKMDMEMDI